MAANTSRRSFVRSVGVAGLGMAILCGEAAAQAKAAAAGAGIRNFKPGMKYRPVGATGLSISAFSIGTTRGELEAVNAGIDKGVNFIHTSMRYMGGSAIEMVAKAIKGRTDKVHIALKADTAEIETALKALGVPAVDFVFFPRHDPDTLRAELPEMKKTFGEWKDKGLAKFAGLTTHKNMAACLDLAVEAGFFSCVMPTWGPKQITELAGQRDRLRKAGIGIIAMKTKGELSEEAYPEQITAVLEDAAICSVLRGVKTFEELNAWTDAANRARGGWLHMHEDSNLARNYAGCAMCGSCEAACPNGVATADIVRCVRYYHAAERDPRLAAEQFTEMQLAGSLARCDNCGACDKACPQRLGVRAQLKRARGLWGTRQA